MDFIEFLQREFLNQLKNTRITERREVSDSDSLGDLVGVDLESAQYSGYIYFWGAGFLDYGVYNMEEDKDEIPINIIETNNYFDQLVMIQTVVSYYN